MQGGGWDAGWGGKAERWRVSGMGIIAFSVRTRLPRGDRRAQLGDATRRLLALRGGLERHILSGVVLWSRRRDLAGAAVLRATDLLLDHLLVGVGKGTYKRNVRLGGLEKGRMSGGENGTSHRGREVCVCVREPRTMCSLLRLLPSQRTQAAMRGPLSRRVCQDGRRGGAWERRFGGWAGRGAVVCDQRRAARVAGGGGGEGAGAGRVAPSVTTRLTTYRIANLISSYMCNTEYCYIVHLIKHFDFIRNQSWLLLLNSFI